jgi:hypothetical protein
VADFAHLAIRGVRMGDPSQPLPSGVNNRLLSVFMAKKETPP